MNFVQKVLAGEILVPEDEILDQTEIWHESDEDVALHEWLGFTWDEWALYLESPEALRSIFMARRCGVDFQSFVDPSDGSLSLAARAANLDEVQRLAIKQWLKRRNLL